MRQSALALSEVQVNRAKGVAACPHGRHKESHSPRLPISGQATTSALNPNVTQLHYYPKGESTGSGDGRHHCRHRSDDDGAGGAGGGCQRAPRKADWRAAKQIPKLWQPQRWRRGQWVLYTPKTYEQYLVTLVILKNFFLITGLTLYSIDLIYSYVLEQQQAGALTTFFSQPSFRDGRQSSRVWYYSAKHDTYGLLHTAKCVTIYNLTFMGEP